MTLTKLKPRSVRRGVPPHDLDAEAAVLSAVLLEARVIDEVADVLGDCIGADGERKRHEMFYSDANGTIMAAALDLRHQHQPIDIVTVASWLRSHELLAHVGGASYLAQLADKTPAVAHVVDHARIVHEKWRLRRIGAVCHRAAAEHYGDVGDVQEFANRVESEIYQVAHDPKAQRVKVERIGAINRRVVSSIMAAAEAGKKVLGLQTGFTSFDAKTSGLHEGELIIVAARPGMGKTAAALNIAVNVATPREHDMPDGSREWLALDGVMIFSLEMPREQLSMRMLCSEARVDVGAFRQSHIQPAGWQRLTEAAAFLDPLNIFVDDTPAIGLLELAAKIRRQQAEFNKPATAECPERKIRLVVIDYLQLMKGREGVSSREQEISEISRGLKQLAKELGLPVIALSQLNRAVETRSIKDKRPQLSDLRESGSLEQDADVVVFIYRDEYYFPDTTNAKGIAEWIIAKQRNGPTGKVLVRFASSYTRFDNLAPGDYPEDVQD